MTAPVRVLLFGDTSSAARVEATLRPSGWRCVAAALPGRADVAPGLEVGTGDIAVLCHDARPALETCRQVAQWLESAGTDVPLVVVLPDGDAGCAADLMRAGARDCVTDSQLSRLAPAIERELEAAVVRHERRKPSGGWPAASRMISATCSPPSPATATC